MKRLQPLRHTVSVLTLAVWPVIAAASPVLSSEMDLEAVLQGEVKQAPQAGLQLNANANSQLNVEQTLLLAHKLTEQGNYPKAKELCERLLAPVAQSTDLPRPNELAGRQPQHSGPVVPLTDEQEKATLQQLLMVNAKSADFKSAVVVSQRLLLKEPNNVSFRSNHGVMLLRSGNPLSAASTFRKLVGTHPNFHSASNNLARILSEANSAAFQPAEALKVATALNTKTGHTNPVYMDTLALAQHAAGHSAKAAATARKAVDLALGRGMVSLAKAISDTVPAYEIAAAAANP